MKSVAVAGDFAVLVTFATGQAGSMGLPSSLVMSPLSCPILLTLSVAFPSAALALGLGDLHVESALHQAFVAHIDLVDASPEDLARLSAGIADADAFQRYQLERPVFLTGTTVAVGQDAQGQPLLLVRSTESFTEPVVTFLVDLHWPGGELIREYTALLDPPELASKAPDAAPAAAAPPTHAPVAQTTPATAPIPSAAAAPDPKPQLRSYTVASGDTLARIASTAGARSRRDRYRMMVAIFRANPAAFQTNLNVLHSGAVLRLPSAEELAAIPAADAGREYKAQLAAWRATDPRALRRAAGAHAPRGADPSTTAVSSSAVDSKPDTASLEADRLALTRRVESLEQSLQEMRQKLQRSPTQQTAAPPAVRPAPASEAAAIGTETRGDSAPPWYRRTPFMALVAGLGLMVAIGIGAMRRRREDDAVPSAWQTAPNFAFAEEPKRVVPVEIPSAEALTPEPAASSPFPGTPMEEPLACEGTIEAQADAHAVNLRPASVATAPGTPAGQIDTGATTAILAPDIEAPGDTVEHKFSFYNPESLADTMHVIVGSELKQPHAFVERRKNPTTVLLQAVEREPHRTDLHLKLLELYYVTASDNRRAFLEAARQMAQYKALVSAEVWARIADMGRKIAPDDELFSEELDDQAVA